VMHLTERIFSSINYFIQLVSFNRLQLTTQRPAAPLLDSVDD